nr:hypothetical protein [Tanacetum cinerariifolium]
LTTTKKSKPSAPKADLRQPVSKPASSQQPEPKPVPAKSQGKKRKLVIEISNKPSPARESRPGLVSKRRKPISSLRLVDESMAEDEGLAGPNPDEQAEGHARPNPDNAAASQPLPSPVVHAGPNLEHMDLEVEDVSTQPHPEQMDEGFTATAYPKVQENLKLTVKEQVILEEPASSSGTLSSLQHLTKDLNFGDLFFNDKPSEADNEKTTAETEAESMVSVTIQQDTSSIPLMTTPMINLTSRPESPNRIGELEHIMTNLIQDNKHLEERLDSHGARLYTLENLDIPQQPTPPPPPAGPSGASGSLQVPPPPPPPSSTNQEAQSFDDEDIGNAHIPKNNWASALASTYSPPLEDSLLVQNGDIAMFMDWFYLEYLRYSSKGSRPALSISKMKVAYYPDVGLEQMVPDQMWIEEEGKYDIAAMYGISHWWFQRQRFYIDRHTSEGDRRAVRTHMRILSIVRIEVFSMYGYDYMKKIVLRHLNHLPPKDKKILTTAVNLWTRHLVIRQRVEDFQLGIESYQTQLNLTKPRWDATGFEYKHGYTIDEALDYRVKEFKVNRMNPGLNTRF